MDYSRTIEEMIQDHRDKMIIDIRDEEEFFKGSYPGAVNYPAKEFEVHKAELKKNIPVYLICYSGKLSRDICGDLAPEGYEIYSVSGGIYSYYLYLIKNEYSDPAEQKAKCKSIENSIVKKFKKEIWCRFTKALSTYELIKDGDKIAVCISGGKDSMLMAKLFQELERHGRKNFEAVYVVMNPGYNRINYETIMRNAALMDIPVTVFDSDIFDIVDEAGGSPCYLCARMRRGSLYSKAKELGCNKIALGHHYDDVIETILMGMLYGAQVQTMMPKLHSTNFPGMELIRPLYLIREEDIKRWRDHNGLVFINCACRLTESCASCGGTEKGSKRAEIKALIAELKQKNPFVESNIFRSVENVNLNTVICYKDTDGERHHFLDAYEAGHDTDRGMFFS
jgi:tRNA(Ile)-lysidine synthase TilS/MesJ/rhodanese-related sulfurtransferase